MTLTQLKSVVAAYFRKTTADLTVESVDLFLMAANNVRKNAELLHDFEPTRVTATLSIDGVNGASLTDAIINGDSGNASYVITGTVTPDCTGYYYSVGTMGEHPFYLNADGTFMLYRNGPDVTDNWWLLAMDAWLGNFDALWEGPEASTPEGTYTDQGTVSTGSPVVAATSGAFSGLKSITSIQRSRADGTYIPLDFTRADVAVERERTELEFQDDYFPAVRYPSDSQFLNRGSTSTLIQRGGKIYVYPVGTETSGDLEVLIEGVAFYRDYTADDLASGYEGDLFLQHGSRFLQYAIICELNYYFQRFVPRQEGVLSPPEQAREAAWRDLLLWDSYLIDPNSTRSR